MMNLCFSLYENKFKKKPLPSLSSRKGLTNWRFLLKNNKALCASYFSKFADDCGSAAQESKLVEKNNSNSRQFLTFVVVRKNRSVEEVNQSIFQNGVYKLFRTSPT